MAPSLIAILKGAGAVITALGVGTALADPISDIIVRVYERIKDGITSLICSDPIGLPQSSIDVINNNWTKIEELADLTADRGYNKRAKIRTFLTNNEKLLAEIQKTENIQPFIDQLKATAKLYDDANQEPYYWSSWIKTIKNVRIRKTFDINYINHPAPINKYIWTNKSDIPRNVIEWHKILQNLGIIDYEIKDVEVPEPEGTTYIFGYGIVWTSTADSTRINDILISVRSAVEETDNLITLLENKVSAVLVGSGTLPGTTTKEPTLEDLIIWAEQGLLSLGQLAIVQKITRARVRTRTKTRRANRLRLKRKRRLRRKRKRPKKEKRLPSQIRSISVNTKNVSRWIARVEFVFPTVKPLRSDDKGSLYFHLKTGTVIKFVRVKRGTFSVISLVFGTGYRVWSQFWKHKIVNRTVLSWFIKRINARDRELAIPEEIDNRKTVYRL